VIACRVEDVRDIGVPACLDVLRAIAAEATFLSVTSEPDIREATNFLKNGVYEYLQEPMEAEEFLRSVVEAIENREAFREILDLNQKLEAQTVHLLQEKVELERKNRELEAVSRLARAVSSTLNLEEILTLLAQCIRETFDFRRIVIGLMDPGASCERAQIVIGFPAEARDETLKRMCWHLKDRKRQAWIRTVLQEGTVLRVNDPATDPLTRGTPLAEIHRNAFVKLPMVARGHIVGSITVETTDSGNPIPVQAMEILVIFADTAAMAVENARLYETMRELSVRDELTGLFNRRHFMRQLEAEWNHALRHDISLSLLLIDVDHFKAFNDGNDHLMGDLALREIATVFVRNTRGIDTVARYGGEEFVVILPNTSKGKAAVVAEKLRAAVISRHFQGEEAVPGGKLTMSTGLAAYPEDAHSSGELLERADLALYRAKGLGRNRVCGWEPTELSREAVN
jgi:diguanylate cyclase (GGDEF)-like protein